MPIEQVAPEFARLIDLEQEVEWLGSGFGADGSVRALGRGGVVAAASGTVPADG